MNVIATPESTSTGPAPAVPPHNRSTRRWSPWSPRVWPVLRHASAPRKALIAAMTAGVVGASVLGGQGVGYSITTAAVVAAVAFALRERPTPWQFTGASGVLLLGSVATVRAAEWLVALCTWTSILVAAAVLSGSWTWRGLGLGTLAPVLLPVRTWRWASTGARQLDTDRAHPRRLAAVVASTVVLVIVFGALFAAADPTFEKIVDAATPDWDLGGAVTRILVFAFVGAATLGAAYLAVNRPRFDLLARQAKSSVSLWEWMVPVAALVGVFALFVAVQMTTLFGGQSHVRTTDGLTNAEYARQGFWQLLAVTALTLLVLATVVRAAPRDTRTQRTYLRVVLGVLCVLALVVVASALHRMSLYERQYGYTTLRLFVTVVEVLLGAVFVLVMVAGIGMAGKWLPRAVGVAVVGAVLSLAALNPDAYVARHSVERFQDTGKIDTRYLRSLSADAAPELDRLPEPYRSCVLSDVVATVKWTEWNLAEDRAAALDGRGPGGANCA
jgi:hypothetical protein|nr:MULTISPECIES: DUF4173 domain-containing protein [unclassified Rhodococcus (in: high G+C Gram-positive bacteria)]